jgi:hypothetical protein
MNSDKPAAIRLSGENISEEHCLFENNDGKVTIHCMPDSVTVSPGLCYTSLKLTAFLVVPQRQTDLARAGEL